MWRVRCPGEVAFFWLGTRPSEAQCFMLGLCVPSVGIYSVSCEFIEQVLGSSWLILVSTWFLEVFFSSFYFLFIFFVLFFSWLLISVIIHMELQARLVFIDIHGSMVSALMLPFAWCGSCSLFLSIFEKLVYLVWCDCNTPFWRVSVSSNCGTVVKSYESSFSFIFG